MILFGKDALRITVREFVAHYQRERKHRGIGNVLIFPDLRGSKPAGPVRCRSRLDGMLNYYDGPPDEVGSSSF
jgi:putative transposase